MHFLDTNILVGAADRNDDLHSIGKAVLTGTSSGRFGTSILTDFVLDEVLTILSRRRELGPRVAAKFVRAFLESPRVRCVFIDSTLFADSLPIFEQHGSSIGFTDATIVAVMRSVGCNVLFSNDGGFDRVPGIVRRTEAV